MKTYNAPADVENKWVVIDATNVVVGRLASYVAKRLRGKHRADFTPHIDTGDHVVIVILHCQHVRCVLVHLNSSLRPRNLVA